jgi:hypothetical protein
MEATGQSFVDCRVSSSRVLYIRNDFVDDVSKRVFELARGCIDELEKQKQYIELLEQYIEELENGVEVSTTEPVQLEQPMEMEESNDNMDNGRPSAVRRRTAKGNQATTRPECETEYGTDNGAGGSGSTEASTN